MMDGETGVDSTLGQGSTFWITARLGLANKLPDVAPVSQNSEAEILKTRQGARILLVEDDLLNREVALDQLANVGFTADIAENGQIAVEMATLNHYDLILMDMQMPVMGGIEASQKILALPGRSTTVIVAMTASAFSEDRAACLDAGMVDHLGKPVEIAALHAILLHWLPISNGRRLPSAPASAPASMPVSVPISSNIPSNNRPDDLNALIAQFAAQPGFNTVAGLASLNGKAEKYLGLLEKFVERHSNGTAEIRQTVAANDPVVALRLAHTLKGAAGALGIVDIQHAAAELELAFKNNETADAISHLLNALQQIEARQIETISRILGKHVETESTQAIDPAQLQPLLKKLCALLAEDDMRSSELAENSAAQLHALLGKDYAQLVKAISDFDFPAALEMIEQALKQHPELS